MKKYIILAQNKNRYIRTFAAFLALSSLTYSSASAQTVIQWSGTASTTTWATAGNWVGGTAPANSLTTNKAGFDQTSYANQPNVVTSTSIAGIQVGDGTTATAALTITDSSGQTLTIGSSGITIAAASGTTTFTGGNGIKLGASQSWANNSSSLLAISNAISNTGNTTPFTLTLNGSGTGGTTFSGIISDGGTTGTTAVTVNTTGGTSLFSAANTFSGGFTLTAGNVQLGNAQGLGATTDAVTVNGGTLDLHSYSPTIGTLSGTGGTILNNNGSGAVTLTVGNSNGSGTYTGVIANNSTGTGTVALTKTGTGTETLAGANTYTGATTVNGGTLLLDFSQATSPLSATNIIASGSALTLGGGTLSLKGGGSGATNSQAFNGLTLTTDTSSALTFSQNSATSLSAALGTIARNAQSTLDITFPTTGTVVTTTTTATNGILTSGVTAYATANGGSTWVANTAGALTAYNSYSTGTGNYLASNNIDVTSGDSVTAATVNTLRFNSASDALTLAGVNTISTGGILDTSTGTGSSITGGTLESGGGKELVIIDYGSLNVGSVIADSASGASALTLSGPGTTTLSGVNTFTGSTQILNGANAKLGASTSGSNGALGASANSVTVGTGATLDLAGFNVTIAGIGGAGTITSSAAGGTLTYTGNGSVNTNLLSGQLAVVMQRQNDNGTDITFSNASNTFTGGLTVRGVNASNVTGTLSTANLSSAGGTTGLTTYDQIRSNSANNPSGPLGTGTITLDNGGIHWNGGYTVANNFSITSNGGLAHFDGSGTFSGSIADAGGIFILTNGFGGNTSFTGSLSSFTGTLGIDTGNVGSVFLSGSATGNSAMNLYFSGTSTTGGNVQWTGTGSPTIQFGEISTGSGSTTTAGLKGSTTASTTTTYQIGDSTANTPVFAGVIQNGTGTAAVTKVGTDTQTLSGANTYTGATTVNQGTLQVNGSLASGSAVTVLANVASSTAVLDGTGTVSGAITLGGGASGTSSIIAPATIGTIGTLTTGAITAAANSAFDFDINSSTKTSDLLAVSGLLSLGSGLATLNVTDLASATVTGGTIFELASFTTESGIFNGLADGSDLSVGANTYQINYGTLNAGQLTLEAVTAVPETSTYVWLCLGLSLLLLLRVRKRLASSSFQEGAVF